MASSSALANMNRLACHSTQTSQLRHKIMSSASLTSTMEILHRVSYNLQNTLGWKDDNRFNNGQDTTPRMCTMDMKTNIIPYYYGVDSSTSTLILNPMNHNLIIESTLSDQDVKITNADQHNTTWMDDFSTWLISTLKRRKKKMNKHKLRKRRKKERLGGNKK